ncbi:MAG: N-formylglutamate amidohydrolase [Gammaproteobacteria bacterium]
MRASDILPLVTCEHGGNDVPEEYRYLFQGQEALLQSHRGWDPGALLFATDLADALGAHLIHATITRLLVDLNRSPHHRDVVFPGRHGLSSEDRQRLMKLYYRPYHTRVDEFIRTAVAAGKRVLHISAHSFTPELDGRIRNADIGLLYDPGREGERHFCRQLKNSLSGSRPGFRVRLNYPYRGTADGLTTRLRREFENEYYAGVEVELNQRFAAAAAGKWRHVRQWLCENIAYCHWNYSNN